MIDTSFTMDVGETVVVGTSRLAGGDKALIALLTAVPRNASTEVAARTVPGSDPSRRITHRSQKVRTAYCRTGVRPQSFGY